MAGKLWGSSRKAVVTVAIGLDIFVAIEGGDGQQKQGSIDVWPAKLQSMIEVVWVGWRRKG